MMTMAYPSGYATYHNSVMYNEGEFFDLGSKGDDLLKFLRACDRQKFP